MKVNVKWEKEMSFVGVSGINKVKMDASSLVGGEDIGFRPTELLLHSLAGCAGINVLNISKKMRIELTNFEMEVSGERNQEPPKFFTKINIDFKISGNNLSDQKVQRLLDLAVGKYCSVSHSLNANISWNFVII